MNFWNEPDKTKMILTVNRYSFDGTATIGRLYINGYFECYTLEDKVRPEGEPKVFGETAIPEGRYEVVIDYSPHFGRDMPHLLSVPNFEGIRIHWGNVSKDTEGCLLLGHTAGKDFIGHSIDEFNQFFPKLETALSQGKVFIDINNNGAAGIA